METYLGHHVIRTGGPEAFPDYFKSELMETTPDSPVSKDGKPLSRLLQIGINGNARSLHHHGVPPSPFPITSNRN